MTFVITRPEVFKSGDTYVVFGEAKVEDTSNMSNAAKQFEEIAKQGFSKEEEAPTLVDVCVGIAKS